MRHADIKPFVVAAKVEACGEDPLWPDRTLTIKFGTSRRENIERMHHAVRTFLLRLRDIPDGHVMCESINYVDEYGGERIYGDNEYMDNGGDLRATQILSKLQQKTMAERRLDGSL